jgi:hypothetical protein
MGVYRTARAQVSAMVAVAAVAVAGLAACTAAQPGREAPAASASASPVPTHVPGTPTLAPAAPAETPTARPLPLATAPGQPASGKSLLTQADSGLTILLPVGAQVTVVLAIAPGMMMWDQPVAKGRAVTRLSASGGYPSSGTARAVFQAVAPGTVELISATDAKCNHAIAPCPVPDQAWQVTVLVPAN